MFKKIIKRMEIMMVLIAVMLCVASESRIMDAKAAAVIGQEQVWSDMFRAFGEISELLAAAAETGEGELLYIDYPCLGVVQSKLQRGFTEELAAVIVESYFYEKNGLVYLRATESFPLLLEDERPACFLIPAENEAEVICIFNDVYEAGDAYLYCVGLLRDESGVYLISALDWHRLQSSS
ncbi:MAG: hypothetical protein Q4B48_07855, partial [Syntrophomonadaceae bacterium]|nr:hypothetical protein [Syntrophomonadaceae bacterium]